MPTGSGICSLPRKEILESLCLVRTCRSFLDPDSKQVFHMAEAEGGLNETPSFKQLSAVQKFHCRTPLHVQTYCNSVQSGEVENQTKSRKIKIGRKFYFKKTTKWDWWKLGIWFLMLTKHILTPPSDYSKMHEKHQLRYILMYIAHQWDDSQLFFHNVSALEN